MAAPALSNKRVARSESSEQLLRVDGGRDGGSKRQERVGEHSAVEHLLLPAIGEPKSAYFRRLGARLRRERFAAACDFERQGIYVYKRPVRSDSGDKAALLASGGSVFYHVVVYVKAGDELTALEFGPANAMDITDNMTLATPAGPVLLPHPAPLPEAECLPMLHIDVPHHPLGAEHVQQALEFAQAAPYHALQSNCIAFADFAVRVLTGGAVKCAPLIFDLVVGQVPAQDSPLLALLALTTQLRWHDVCDGSRMLRAFLQQHLDSLPPVPGIPADLSLLLPEPAVPGECQPGAAAHIEPAAAALPPSLSGPLAAFLASSGLLPLATPQLAAQAAAVQPAGSSSGSEDTCGGVAEEAGEGAATEGDVGAAQRAARLRHEVSTGSSLASLASSGTSLAAAPKGGLKGLGLHPRRGAKAAGS